ncbi:ABC transporter ATP-binding protein [Actinoallomurus iriomotensis]|uniref:ABC transporter ATP-binding protein n=1 Tax=Actinoallomurus iriomotensis TaxID=478107 RepID=UPI0025526DD8|nr:ABC transporter ATP-binding protein [Actinoallomurus iriomotensis]
MNDGNLAVMNDGNPVVVTDVTKKFGSANAVRSVSWAPRRGEVTALVGLNGAGKSTLMRIMTGLIKPMGGAVTVPAEQGRRSLSAMIEAPALFTGLTVRHNLRIHRILTGAHPDDVQSVATLTRIDQVMSRRVRALSQGYRQRVAIAVALLGSPAVLLLDEPTNALDPEATAHLRVMVRRIADRGTAVIVSTHMLRELEGVADTLTVMHEGQVLYDGPFASFVGPPSLRVRAQDAEAMARLTARLQDEGIAARQATDGVRVPADGRHPDRAAQRVFTTAVDAGIELVELGHITPTLEEAFHAAISGARS